MSRVGEQHRVLVAHPLRNQARPDVGEGHAYVLGLAAVVPAAGVGVAVDAADRRGVGVDVVAVRVEPAAQNHHEPQKTLNGTVTRSPTLRFCTDGPTWSMMPMNSWPKVVPTRVSGIIPWSRCRSEPQIAVSVTRTIASLGCSIRGMALPSTRTLYGPRYTIACKGAALRCPSRPGRRPRGGGCPVSRAGPTPRQPPHRCVPLRSAQYRSVAPRDRHRARYALCLVRRRWSVDGSVELLPALEAPCQPVSVRQ